MSTNDTEAEVKVIESPKKREQRLRREAKEAQAALEEQLRNPVPTVEAKATASVGDPEDLDTVREARTRKIGSKVGSGLRTFGRKVIDTDLRDIGQAAKHVVPKVKVAFRDDAEATTTDGVLTPDEVTDPAPKTADV